MRMYGIFNGLNGQGRGKGCLSTFSVKKNKTFDKKHDICFYMMLPSVLLMYSHGWQTETFFILYETYSPAAYRPNFACGCIFARLRQRLGKNDRERIRYIWRTILRRVIKEFLRISSLFRSSNCKKLYSCDGIICKKHEVKF